MKKATLIITLVISFTLLMTVLIITGFEIFKIDLFSQFIDKKISRIHDFYIIYLTIFSVMITAILAYIAWNELSGIKRAANADFLLRIDDRYGSDQIIKARIIIHRLYREEKPECTHETYICSSCKELHIKNIRERIKKIGQEVHFAEDFIYLRNFLDFLETIGYFAHQNYVTPNQVNELLGGMVEYHYDIFKDWIDYRQKRDKNTDYYCELTWLVKELRKGRN